MRRLRILLIFLGLSGITFAQNKVFTVKDGELASLRELSPKNMPNLQWRGQTANFTYQDLLALYQQSVTNSDPVKLMTLAELNSIIQKNNSDTLKYFPYITWATENEFYFFSSSNWYAFNYSAKKVIASIALPNEAINFQVYYPKKLIAYTLKNNVFIAEPSGATTTVTHDRNPDIVNGDIVSRNEFGIDKGLFWSPNGNYLAFYRKDNSKVKSYPLVNIQAREAEVNYIKYPMAGMSSENVSLGIYGLNKQSYVFIEKNDTVSEKYLTNISWAPDENNIYIQVLNRLQNHMMLNRYTVSDGALVKTLFEEKNDKYVEPLNPILFLRKMPGEFIYQSRRDGYNHAYLYNTDGSLIKQLTSGKWELTSILALDNNDNLFYTSGEESPIEQHGYKLDLRTGQKTKLTHETGIHDLTVNANGHYCLDNYSSTAIPRKIDIISALGKTERTVLTASNPLAGFTMPEMTIGTLKAADGITDLYYRLIKPIQFDPAKKYPAIIYVYGGPHTQLIENRWLGGARLWDYMMAQKGYVVLTVDNRGSSNRGLAFENVIHRQCGVNEMLDQMEGVTLLKKSGFVDTTRIGVHGWSYGGFMTISLMLNYPKVFKVGVAGGPVIDWKYYEIMYGERYMDTPQENPLGYDNTALTPKAKNLEGKLLIIHGAQDPTVVWQNSLLFIQECIKNQRPVDYFIYPMAEHNVRGMERVHLMEKITDYFDKNL